MVQIEQDIGDIQQDPRSEADHKSHTSLYLHNNAPRQQLMTTPCEAIMEDTRETRGQRRGRGQLSAIHHHFMRQFTLDTYYMICLRPLGLGGSWTR